jgi:hypothetical protein
MRSIKNVRDRGRVIPLFFLFILYQAILLVGFRASLSQELSKTTIRNDTQKPVRYAVQLDRPGERQERKVIDPGHTHHFPGDTALKLTFPRDGKPLPYRLNPGGVYFFQLDEQNKLDVYADIEKKADVEDAVPFVATPRGVVRKMLEMACVDNNDVVYDLGCGDGRIVIMAAEKFGALGVGIDIDDRRIKESKAHATAAGVEDRVKFRLQDVFKADISEATVVTLYMLTEINQRLCPQLEQQLKPGTVVITHSYPVPGWASRLIDFTLMSAEDGEEHIIYLYQK